MAKAKSGISPDLEAAVSELLKDSRTNKEMALEDKLAIIDRAIKWEMLKNKVKDAEAGSGWDDIGAVDGPE